jgi:putative transposase
MSFRLVQELAAGEVLVAVACRVLGVSTSGYYEWRGRPPSRRALADRALSVQIREIHTRSRGTYGVPRVHAELRLGRGLRCGRKRVARLMRAERLSGVYRRRGKHARPAAAVHDDLVQRRFQADAPNRLWLTDITEHPTREGKVYCAAVLDVYSRRIVGWSSPTTCGRNSSSTPWRWRAGGGDHRPARPFSTQTAARNTRPGPSATACALPACSARWAASAPPWTTR